MKEKIKVRFNLRVYFTLVVLLAIILTVLLTQCLTAVFNYVFGAALNIPTAVWYIVLSMIIGSIISIVFGKAFFTPVLRLSKAMQQVASGDFSIRLETRSHFPEMREAYDSFNRMVKDLAATEMLQSDFVSNVSHEFKTPINAIEGYATLLQDRTQPREEQSVYCHSQETMEICSQYDRRTPL